MDNGLSDAKMCWICHEEGPDEEGKPLMHAGCSCRGSVGYCHSSCLVSFTTVKADETVASEDDLNIEIWMKCRNCGQSWSGDMAGIMKEECHVFLMGEALLVSNGIVEAWGLISAGEFLDAERLLIELHSRACQVGGFEHTRTKQIDILMTICHLELAHQKLEKDIEKKIAEKTEKSKIQTMLNLAWPIEAWALVYEGKFHDARRLVADLHTRACQVGGPEHTRAKQTKALLNSIDQALENHDQAVMNQRSKKEILEIEAKTEMLKRKAKKIKSLIQSFKLDLAKLNYYYGEFTIDFGLWSV